MNKTSLGDQRRLLISEYRKQPGSTTGIKARKTSITLSKSKIY